MNNVMAPDLVLTDKPGINGPALSVPNKFRFARIQFADWLHENHPDIFARAIAAANRATPIATGLGQVGPPAPTTDIKSFWQKFTEAATTLGTTYLTLKNQRDAMRLNLERARQGLPPLDAATTAPVVRTQVDIDPALAQKLVSTAGEGINRTMLMVGGIALVAILIMRKR